MIIMWEVEYFPLVRKLLNIPNCSFSPTHLTHDQNFPGNWSSLEHSSLVNAESRDLVVPRREREMVRDTARRRYLGHSVLRLVAVELYFDCAYRYSKNIFILWAPCGALHQKYTSSFAMCWDERSYVFMDSKIMWHWNTEKDIISMQRRLLCDLDISRGNVVQKHTMNLWTLKHEGSCRVVMSVMCLFTCCTCFKLSMDLIML